VLSGQYRTICIVQCFRGRGTKQRPAEDTGVRRHDNEIESVSPGELGDSCRRIARQQNSRALTDGKLRLQKRVEFVPGKDLLFFGNLGGWPHVELERVVTVKIEDVN